MAGEGHRVPASRRAKEQLLEIVQAAGDVAANQIRIARFQLRSGMHRARQDEFAEAGSKTLNLRFNRIGHGDGASVGNVTICPGGVPSQRSASRIEETGLR